MKIKWAFRIFFRKAHFYKFVAIKQRRRRDSNPRTGDKTDKLISSQPRYGHFGTSPDLLLSSQKTIIWRNSRNIIARLDRLEKRQNYFFLLKKEKRDRRSSSPIARSSSYARRISCSLFSRTCLGGILAYLG